jgi:nicotinamidase-related amidase
MAVGAGWLLDDNYGCTDKLFLSTLKKDSPVLLDPDQCQLVLVDYQVTLMPAIQDEARVIRKARLLAQMAHLMAIPVWATTQRAEALGPFVPELAALVPPPLDKLAFNACADGLIDVLQPPHATSPAQGKNARSLPKHLRKPAAVEPLAPARPVIVLAGVEAHVCVLQTALDLLANEFEVWVVSDACGSRQTRDSDAAFDRLAGNGVELVTAEMAAFEWLGGADHPDFAAALGYIKAA